MGGPYDELDALLAQMRAALDAEALAKMRVALDAASTASIRAAIGDESLAKMRAAVADASAAKMQATLDTAARAARVQDEAMRATFDSASNPALLAADTTRTYAAIQQQLSQTIDPAMLAELTRLSEQRQADAVLAARGLFATEPELQGLLATQGEAVRRSVELLAQALPDRDAVMHWLHMARPDLEMQTPLEVMREGHAETVEAMLSDTLRGIPS